MGPAGLAMLSQLLWKSPQHHSPSSVWQEILLNFSKNPCVPRTQSPAAPFPNAKQHELSLTGSRTLTPFGSADPSHADGLSHAESRALTGHRSCLSVSHAWPSPLLDTDSPRKGRANRWREKPAAGAQGSSPRGPHQAMGAAMPWGFPPFCPRSGGWGGPLVAGNVGRGWEGATQEPAPSWVRPGAGQRGSRVSLGLQVSQARCEETGWATPGQLTSLGGGGGEEKDQMRGIHWTLLPGLSSPALTRLPFQRAPGLSQREIRVGLSKSISFVPIRAAWGGSWSVSQGVGARPMIPRGGRGTGQVGFSGGPGKEQA